MTDIMSSPARNNIDPLICSYLEQNEKVRTASTPNNLAPKTRLLSSGQAQFVNHGPAPNLSSTNSVNAQIPGNSGWTPYLSRTSQPEGILSHVSTPSSKMFSALFRQSQNLMPQEFDCGSLNLTPFLAHNVNMNQGSAPLSASQNVSFTPLCDKSLHLADFFMDSPIRQTPRKVSAMTPSRFSIAPDNSKIDGQLLSELSLKRSITLIDTPARQPFKKMEQSVKDEQADASRDEIMQPKLHNVNAPSTARYDLARAALKEISSNSANKTPFRNGSENKNKFQTPAHPVSSPSTVIMSSVTKSPEKDKDSAPPSPTPQKEIKIDTAEPVMGIFSERKPKMGSLNEPKTGGKKSQKNKSSGMNRFQIVFTDVHTLMNSKKKTSKNSNEAPGTGQDKSDVKSESKQKKKVKEEPAQGPAAVQQTESSPHLNYSNVSTTHGGHSYINSLSQNFNTSINTSREFSMMANSMVNSTSSNITAVDQSSFDLMQGGLMSTPNGKYLQDLLFEKFSPNIAHNLTARFNLITEHEDAQDGSGYQHKSFMPPPKTINLQQAAQQALRNRHQDIPASGQNMPMQHQMHMIHPDLQSNAIPGAYSQSSPQNKDSLEYMYGGMDMYLQVNVSKLQLQAMYSTSSPTQGKLAAKPRKRKLKKA